jgi:hypothetical protein
MINSLNNNDPRYGCGYKKCAKCYWYDNCPLRNMEEEEIEVMKETRLVNMNEFANPNNVQEYFDEYCEFYTPFDDDEIAIIEYERDLKFRTDYYQDLVDEQEDD